MKIIYLRFIGNKFLSSLYLFACVVEELNYRRSDSLVLVFSKSVKEPISIISIEFLRSSMFSVRR